MSLQQCRHNLLILLIFNFSFSGIVCLWIPGDRLEEFIDAKEIGKDAKFRVLALWANFQKA